LALLNYVTTSLVKTSVHFVQLVTVLYLYPKVIERGGHFERAFGAFLAFDVGEVEGRAFHLQDLWLRTRQNLRALEGVGELDQRGGRNDLDLRARPGCLGPAFGGADHAGIRADRSRQDAGDGRDRAVQAEFAQDREAGQRVMRNGADGSHQAKRNRQIVVTA